MLFLIFFGLVAISGIILMMKYNDWKSVMGVVFLVVGGLSLLVSSVTAVGLNSSLEQNLEMRYNRIIFDYQVEDSNDFTIISISRSNLSFNQESLSRGALLSLREKIFAYNNDRIWSLENKDNPWLNVFTPPIGNSKYIKVVTELSFLR